MRLFEAIVNANHRAAAGDPGAGLHPAEFAAALPVVALTCYDPRMHPLMPEVLGIAERDFVWLTNAGNIVPGPWSGAVRSLALACAVHEAKEIAIIGHNDCRFFQPGRYFLARRLQAYGMLLGAAATKLDEFLRGVTDEAANVRTAVAHVRESPLIPRPVPVHGLMVDVASGKLDWVANGYAAAVGGPASVVDSSPAPPAAPDSLGRAPAGPPTPDLTGPLDFKIGGELPPIGGG